MPKCVPMTRSSELRPLTLLLYVVPVTLMELLRRWGSGATSGSGGGGGGGGGGGTGTHTHIGNAEEEAKVYEGLQHLSRSEPVNLFPHDSVHFTHIPAFIHTHIKTLKREKNQKSWKRTSVWTYLALCIRGSVRSCSGSVPAPHTSAAGKQTARSPVWLEYPAPGTRPRSECQHSWSHGKKGKVWEIAWQVKVGTQIIGDRVTFTQCEESEN